MMLAMRGWALLVSAFSAACATPLHSERVELPPIVEVSRGAGHICARSDAGDMYCWGALRFHHVDGVDGTNIDVPTPVSLARGIEDVIITSRYACGRDPQANDILCWWNNLLAKGPHACRVDMSVQSFVGDRPHCGITATGEVSCMGGEYSYHDYFPQEPRPPNYFYHGRIYPFPVKAVQIAIDWNEGCILGADGRVYCEWLPAEAGQHGGGPLGPWTADPGNVVKIAMASNNRYALRDNGELHCGGRWDASSRVIVGLPPVRNVVARFERVCAITMAGVVQCWDEVASCDELDERDLVQVEDLEGAVTLSLDDRGGCAVLSDGGLRCWPAEAHACSPVGVCNDARPVVDPPVTFTKEPPV
jgi:hypothetical protein